MSMNGITFKMRQAKESEQDDEVTQHGVEVTTTRDMNDDIEVTEITVRVRPSEIKNIDELDNHGDFNVQRMRKEKLEIVNVESLVKGYQDPSGRRSAPRVAKSLSVVIYTHNQSKSFRSSTMNVSVGGALLNDVLPNDFQAGPLEILFVYEDAIANKKQYFMFKGHALPADGENKTSRIQFKEATPAAQQALLNLLAGFAPPAKKTA